MNQIPLITPPAGIPQVKLTHGSAQFLCGKFTVIQRWAVLKWRQSDGELWVSGNPHGSMFSLS
jgi:hypothetical protein